MFWRRLIRAIFHLILAAGFVALAAPEWPAFGEIDHQLDTIVGLREFDFVVWEGNALLTKLTASLANDHTYLEASAQKQLVINTLDLMRQANQLESKIELIFTDPGVLDPNTASADLQDQLAEIRSRLAKVQPAAEAVVQDQVSSVLAEEGFTILRQTFPPVLMHMTQLPTLLIISPRDRIEQMEGIPLVNGLGVEAQDRMETAVTDQLNLSGLVVPLGGLGLYPTMIMETSSINWLAEVTAHEWTHNWLTPYPVSLQYLSDPRMRTINETVASIAGKEIGQKVIQRYYPEYVPPPAAEGTPQTTPETPPAFDFRAEMRQTRVQVDQMLAAGKIDEAEAYMEARRRLFWENGYRIRKLNQAYFAFHGAYADQPGATGADPIGPKLLEIRSHSPSLHAFLQTIAGINDFSDLEKVYEQVNRGSG